MDNLFDSMRLQLFLQAACGISPFIRHGNRFVSSRWINVHTLVILLIFVFVVLTSLSDLSTEIPEWSGEGSYLWGIIIVFELLFTNTAFPLLLLHSMFWKKEQMGFYNRIFALDEKFQQHFQVNLQPTHRTLFKRSVGMFLISFVYFGGVLIIALLFYQSATSRTFVTYSIAYQVEQATTGVLSSAIINTALILKSRFKLLQMVKPTLLSSEGDIASRKLRFSVWLYNFKELCGLVDMLSQNFGSILILRFAHDFTLITSQCYLIFWILFSVDSSNMNKLVYVSVVGYWMLQNIVKIGATTLVTHMTINEVRLEYLFRF